MNKREVGSLIKEKNKWMLGISRMKNKKRMLWREKEKQEKNVVEEMLWRQNEKQEKMWRNNEKQEKILRKIKNNKKCCKEKVKNNKKCCKETRKKLYEEKL